MPEEATRIKVADGNGLAVMSFGVTTWVFSLMFLHFDSLGWNDASNKDKNPGVSTAGIGFGTNAGAHNAAGPLSALSFVLQWVSLCGLLVAGILQAFNGDLLGTTSYILHGLVLGVVGYAWGGLKGHALGYIFYAMFYFNICFAVVAFTKVNPGKSWGIFYASLALMFLTLGLRFTEALYDETNQGDYPELDKFKIDGVETKYRKYDKTGDIIAGIFCLIVTLQTMYLVFPLLVGKGKLL